MFIFVIYITRTREVAGEDIDTWMGRVPSGQGIHRHVEVETVSRYGVGSHRIAVFTHKPTKLPVITAGFPGLFLGLTGA